MTNDAAVQLRCNDGTSGNLSLTYTPRMGGNGVWLWNATTQQYEYWAVPGSGGIMTVNVGSCYVDKVPGQALVAGVLYYVYVTIINNKLSLNFSTIIPSPGDPYAIYPITGWSCANGDPTQRLVGMVQLNSSGQLLVSGGDAPNGVAEYNLLSYYNRQRVTLQVVPSGYCTSPVWSSANISNGKIASIVCWDGDEPFITFSGGLSNNTFGANTWLGISLNGADPLTWTQIGCGVANYSYPFCFVFPAGSPNYIATGGGGRNTYQVVMKVTDGSRATLNNGCLLAGSFSN